VRGESFHVQRLQTMTDEEGRWVVWSGNRGTG